LHKNGICFVQTCSEIIRDCSEGIDDWIATHSLSASSASLSSTTLSLATNSENINRLICHLQALGQASVLGPSSEFLFHKAIQFCFFFPSLQFNILFYAVATGVKVPSRTINSVQSLVQPSLSRQIVSLQSMSTFQIPNNL
jgi:hypothetical protein